MSDSLYIVLEFASRGSLRNVIDAYGTQLGLDWRINVINDIALGMAYLYSRPKPVQHQDLKPANVLIMDDWSAKVCDFGLSESDVTLSSSSMSQASGANGFTLAYASPEVLDEEDFTEKCDIFSFGITAWETITGRVPYSGLKPGQILKKVYKAERPEGGMEGIDEDLKALVEKCWAAEPDDRPSFGQVKDALKPFLPETVKLPSDADESSSRLLKSPSITRLRLESDLEQAQRLLEAERRDAEAERKAMQAKLEDLEKKEAIRKAEEEEATVASPSIHMVERKSSDGISGGLASEDPEELWVRMKSDADAKGIDIPVGDDLVMAFEANFLDGEDVNDREILISLLDIKKNGVVSGAEFKKFFKVWRKSGYDTMSGYLKAKSEEFAEEEARRKEEKEEEARKKAEEEARKKAEEEARRKAAAEKKRKEEEEARRKAEEEARKKAEEEARKAAAEKKRKEEEEARRKAEEEAKRKAQQPAAALRLWIGAGGKEEDLTGGKGHDELAQWTGIETNADGEITKINWCEKGLSGTILEEPLGKLTALTYLGLDTNELTGEIPSSIGNLTKLTILYLQ